MKWFRWGAGILLGLVGLSVVALGVAAFLVDLDALVERYRPEIEQAVSQALNRRVQVEGIDSTWFPTLGVQVNGVRIGNAPLDGPDPGLDAEPFVTAEALRVGVAVWPALVSLGKDVQITEVVLREPWVRVVRTGPETFNVSTLGGAATATATETTQEGPSALDRLEAVSVGRFAVEGAHLIYEDRATADLDQVEVHPLDVEALNVALGRPLEVALDAVSEGGRIDLDLKTGPLAQRVSDLGVPELERLELEVEAFPLGPWPLPVEGTGVSLKTAAIEADLILRFGPDGPELSGPLAVRKLRLAPDGGRAFDVETVLALALSPRFDRVRLDETQLAVPPLRTTLSGAVSLGSAGVAFDDLMLRTRSPARLPSLLAIAAGTPELPGRLAFDVRASGSLDDVDARVRVDLTELGYDQDGLSATGRLSAQAEVHGSPSAPALKLDLDGKDLAVAGSGFQKKAGIPLRFQVDLAPSAEALDATTFAVTLGSSTLDGSLHYPFSGKGRLSMELGTGRDGISLSELSDELGLDFEGLPEGAVLAMGMEYGGPAENPMAGNLKVPALRFEAGRSKLQASATVSAFNPLRFSVEGRSRYLDVAPFMGDEDEGEPPSNEGPAETPLLSGPLAKARGRVEFRAGRLDGAGLPMKDLRLVATVRDGAVQLDTLRFEALGGQVDASGTRAKLDVLPARYDLSTKLKSLKAKEMLAQWTSFEPRLAGDFSADVALHGEGLTVEQALRKLAGSLSFRMARGRFEGVNLVEATAGPLRDALSFVSAKGPLQLAGTRGATDFRRLAGSIELENGTILLKKPLQLDTDYGQIRLTGGIGLDRELDLNGTLQMSPKLVATLTRGKVRPGSAIPLDFDLGCGWASPCVRNVNAASTAERLARSLVGEKVEEAKQQVEREVKEKAREVERKVEEKAKETVEEAKKKVEREVKEKVEEKAKEKVKDRLENLFGR